MFGKIFLFWCGLFVSTVVLASGLLAQGADSGTPVNVKKSVAVAQDSLTGYASKKYWPYNHLFMKPFPTNKEAARLYEAAGKVYIKNVKSDNPQNIPEEALLQIIENLKKMESLNPNHADAYYVLGWAIYFYSEQYGPLGELSTDQMFRESEQYYEKATELDPTNWEIFGTLLYRSDKSYRPRILALCDRILKANPNNSTALSFCGEVLIDDGKMKEGLLSIEKALSFPMDKMTMSGIYRSAAGALARSGHPEEAKVYRSKEFALRKEFVQERKLNSHKSSVPSKQ